MFNSKRKIIARQESVIEEYYRITGRKYLPTKKEYWTLASLCSTPEGKLLPGSELDCLLKSDFLTTNQFHSIEHEKDNGISIHESNMRLDGNWYLGKFHNVFQDNAKNPGILNVDTMNTFKKFQRQFWQILDCASQWDDVVCIFNFVSRMDWYKRKCEIDDIKNIMSNSNNYHISKCWNFHDNLYEYDGKCGISKMLTLYFYRGNFDKKN